MVQKKKRVVFYEEPQVLDEIDRAIQKLSEQEHELISCSCFIRRSIKNFLKTLRESNGEKLGTK